MDCPHRIGVKKINYHKGGTAFRVEFFGCDSDRCLLKKKSVVREREMDVIRWIQSGGCPSSILHPCAEGTEKECS